MSEPEPPGTRQSPVPLVRTGRALHPQAYLGLGAGLIYEDCSYHPVLCTLLDPKDDYIEGISLIDGSAPRACSPEHCDVIPLTLEQAVLIKSDFAGFVAARSKGLAPDEALVAAPGNDR